MSSDPSPFNGVLSHANFSLTSAGNLASDICKVYLYKTAQRLAVVSCNIVAANGSGSACGRIDLADYPIARGETLTATIQNSAGIVAGGASTIELEIYLRSSETP